MAEHLPTQVARFAQRCVLATLSIAFFWAAFGIARNWRHCQWLSVGIGVGTYVVAFGVALVFDQPFGPVLIAVLIVFAGAMKIARST